MAEEHNDNELLDYEGDMGGDGLDEDDEAPLEEEQLPAEHGNGAADPMQAEARPVADTDPGVNPGANAGAPEAHHAATGTASDPLQLPPHGTEVYCANLDHEASEEQIRDFCVEAGQVASMRVPKHPGGKVKGYAFVVYKTREEAANAIATLNQTELKDFPGRRVRVIESQVKNRLFVGNLPKSMTQEQVLEGLRAEVAGVEDMDLMMDKEDPNGTLNRGFGFVGFYNNACADLALRKLTANEFRLGGRPLTVTWAEPKKNDNLEKEKVKSIYVGNLPESVTEDKLREAFAIYGEVERVMLPPSRDPSAGRAFREYGFVHFSERAYALKAVEAAEAEKPQLDGAELQVHMARPQTDHRTEGYGQQGGYGRGGGSYSRGGGRGSYGRGRGGYGQSDDYGAGDDYDGGYGATAATAATGGYGAAMGGFGFGGAGLTMVPMVLPNGQVGYMLSGTGAPGMMAAAGTTGAAGGGPVRRAAGGYGSSGGYGSGGGGYGGRGGYSGGRGGGRGGGGGGRYKPY